MSEEGVAERYEDIDGDEPLNRLSTTRLDMRL